jgi:threonine/homoserine/homoserine lactone efflux protein
VGYGSGDLLFLAFEAAVRRGASRVYVVSLGELDGDGFSVVYSWNGVSVFEYTPPMVL